MSWLQEAKPTRLYRDASITPPYPPHQAPTISSKHHHHVDRLGSWNKFVILWETLHWLAPMIGQKTTCLNDVSAHSAHSLVRTGELESKLQKPSGDNCA